MTKKYPITISLNDLAKVPDGNLDECLESVGSAIKIMLRMLRIKAKESKLGEEKAMDILTKTFDCSIEFVPDKKNEFRMKIIGMEEGTYGKK